MLRTLLLASALAIAVPAGAALAHDNDDWWGDQDEHEGIHDDIDAGHAQAHERGFRSEAEHHAYHRALRDIHREFHEDHPGAWNDIRLPREHRRYYGYSTPYYGTPYYGGYAPSYGYGYAPYSGYSGWSYSYGSGW